MTEAGFRTEILKELQREGSAEPVLLGYAVRHFWCTCANETKLSPKKLENVWRCKGGTGVLKIDKKNALARTKKLRCAKRDMDLERRCWQEIPRRKEALKLSTGSSASISGQPSAFRPNMKDETDNIITSPDCPEAQTSETFTEKDCKPSFMSFVIHVLAN